MRRIEEGLPFSTLVRLSRVLEISAPELAELIDLPPATFHRRKRAGRLAPDESDRLARIARIVTRATRLCEDDAAAARHWLKRPKAALDDRTPIEFARTDIGAREVEALIERLEYGVYS